MEHDESIAQGMGVYPPLGILYVGTYMKKYSKHSLHILDPDPENMSLEEIGEKIKTIKPDIVGITTFTNTLKTVVDELKIIKNNLPDCITVIGGPHVSLYPHETMGINEVDYAIKGDGEKAFLDLLTVLNGTPVHDQEEELKKIEGIVFRTSNGRIHQNEYARVMDLDSFPFPDRSLIKQHLYYCILGNGGLMTTAASSRGCPYKCTFCNSPDKKYRYRTAKNIVDEIEYLADMGITEIFFFDDTFNLQKERVLEICNAIIKRNLYKRVRWAFRGRVNTLVDEAVVKKLKEAGCERIQLGIEKATDEALRKIKKGATVQQIITAVYLLYKYRILSVGNFILFTPGEDEKDAEEIIRFSLTLKLDHVEYHVFAPYPGSEIYDMGLKTKFFEKDYWSEYAKCPHDDFFLLWEEKVVRQKMLTIINNAYRRFYFRPRIIWNELKRLSSWAEFKRKFKGVLIILHLQHKAARR
ncbi:B12-binding domain-containing radical SAM protein [Elusimicrobiota bacterium]